MKTQEQHFYTAHRRIADQNEGFLFLVKNGLTQGELRTLIKRKPEVYSRFSNWLIKLPSE